MQMPVWALGSALRSQKRPRLSSHGSSTEQLSPRWRAQTRQQEQSSSTALTPGAQVGGFGGHVAGQEEGQRSAAATWGRLTLSHRRTFPFLRGWGSICVWTFWTLQGGVKAKYLGVVCCCKEARRKITSFCAEGLPQNRPDPWGCRKWWEGTKAQRDHFPADWL